MTSGNSSERQGSSTIILFMFGSCLGPVCGSVRAVFAQVLSALELTAHCPRHPAVTFLGAQHTRSFLFCWPFQFQATRKDNYINCPSTVSFHHVKARLLLLLLIIIMIIITLIIMILITILILSITLYSCNRVTYVTISFNYENP